MITAGHTKYYVRIIVSFLLLIFFTFSTNASRPVKIATIAGIPSFSFDKTKGSQHFVDRMNEFWENEINQVLPDKPDLILLPEICDIPAGLTAKDWRGYLQVRGDQTIDQLASIARENHCYIAFGTLRTDREGNLRNSAILLDRDGNIAGIYNKSFPTIGEIEDGIVPGNETPVFQCDFGRIALVICFDLNFKKLLDKFAEQQPDIILFPSNYHGSFMQNVWAYWCRSFFVGCINGSGRPPSEIRTPLGDVIASNSNYFDFVVATINLDSRVVHLGYNFSKLAALKKKYGNAVTITDPGYLGAVLVSYESDGSHIDKIIKEFDIELIDPYFDRSRQKRAEALRK